MLLELAKISWGERFVAIGIVAVCVLLIIIILLQKGRGGGLSSAFGGGGSGSAFGAKTGDVFTWVTVAFASCYLLLTVVGNFVFRPAIADQPEITISAPTDGEAIDVLPPDVIDESGEADVLPTEPEEDTASNSENNTEPVAEPADLEDSKDEDNE